MPRAIWVIMSPKKIDRKEDVCFITWSFVRGYCKGDSSIWISEEGVIEDKNEELHLQENKKPKSKKQKEFDSQQWDQVKDEDEHEDK